MNNDTGGASENYSRRISLASTQAGIATRCLQKRKKKEEEKEGGEGGGEEGEEKDEEKVEKEKQRFAGLSSLFFHPPCRGNPDHFSFCFHARRPVGDALKPGCNPGDAIK